MRGTGSAILARIQSAGYSEHASWNPNMRTGALCVCHQGFIPNWICDRSDLPP